MLLMLQWKSVLLMVKINTAAPSNKAPPLKYLFEFRCVCPRHTPFRTLSIYHRHKPCNACRTRLFTSVFELTVNANIFSTIATSKLAAFWILRSLHIWFHYRNCLKTLLFYYKNVNFPIFIHGIITSINFPIKKPFHRLFSNIPFNLNGF